MSKRKRSTFGEQSVATWMQPNESYAEAKKRLDELWKQNRHPAQLDKKNR